MKTPNKSTINIENYRKLVQTYINVHMYNSALFWADKVVALTGDPRDIYWLAQCMYLQKEYHRAVHLLKSRNLEKAYILCNYLTVKCLLEANELNEALKVINLLDIDVFQSNITSTPSLSNVDHMLFDDTPKNQIFSSVMYLKGKVLENMDNRGLAADCYKQALYFDVYCFDAFDSLIRYQMLTAAEEQDLLNSLPISEQCTAEESEVLRVLYESKLKKYHTPTQEKLMINTPLHKAKFTQNIIASLPGTPSIVVTASPTIKSTPNVSKTNDKNLKRLKTIDERVQKLDGPVLVKLNDSLDMHVSQAERLYYNCDFQQCSELTEAILRQDPYHSSCLPIHISCQVELKESNKLFSLAHTLVDLYPDLAISWFAVGCYYYILGKSDYARRYLAKATCLDRLFGPAWLAYGHSFAIEKEHDQAMAAYFKASQLMKGCHLPLLYIGLECGLTNNVRLAEKFFSQAQSIAPDDPFILHEKGVICFQNLEYLEAEKNFKDALTKIKSVKRGLIPKSWCALLNNLGHTCRKLRKYQEALEYHEQALLLTPQCAPTYSAIGYCHVLLRNNEEAVDWFHKALGLRRADSFSATMLNYVIEQLSEEQPAFPGAPETLPKFNLSRTPAAVQETLEELDLEESSKMETTNNEMSMSMEMSDASGMVKDD